jgi:RNA polymerase sigma-70 factor (ECF subfamily)
MDHHRQATGLPIEEAALAAAPAVQYEDEHERRMARQALWRLTPDQRQVIVLKYYQGLSNEEVAAALDKPVGAVKSLQHRALDALRRMLTGPESGMERVA